MAQVGIAVVDAEGLFTRVFLPQMEAERRALQAKAQATQELQTKKAKSKLRVTSGSTRNSPRNICRRKYR